MRESACDLRTERNGKHSSIVDSMMAASHSTTHSSGWQSIPQISSRIIDDTCAYILYSTYGYSVHVHDPVSLMAQNLIVCPLSSRHSACKVQLNLSPHMRVGDALLIEVTPLHMYSTR